MNFQDLAKVEKSQFYLDVAFKAGIKKAALLKSSIRIKSNKVEKARRIEHARIMTVKDKLVNSLYKIITRFPSMDSLPEFYVELIKCTLDFEKIKKSLGNINWAMKKTSELCAETFVKFNVAKSIAEITKARQTFSGRTSSVLKKINPDLAFLETARMEMKGFPSIKTSLMTVAITGFPNVGKSTLLKKITHANPKIGNYPFTTKNLNLGYAYVNDSKVQFIDTPGTLNRYNKMNAIEKKSFLVMKYVADLLIFIFDLTGEYPVERQTELFRKIQEFDKPIIIFVSKADLIDGEMLKEFCNSCNALHEAEKLEVAIEKELSNVF